MMHQGYEIEKIIKCYNHGIYVQLIWMYKVILVRHGHSHLVILSLSLLCLSLEALKGHEQAWCMGPKALIALYLYHDLY